MINMKCFCIFRKIKRNNENFIEILEKFRKFKENLKKIQEDFDRNQGGQGFEQSCFVQGFEHAQNALHKTRVLSILSAQNLKRRI